MQKNASRLSGRCYLFFNFLSLFIDLSLGFFHVRERFRRTVLVSERLVNKILTTTVTAIEKNATIKF